MTAATHPVSRAPSRPASDARPAQRLSRLAAHQFHADLRCFLRNIQSVFFTLVLPVLFLVILASIFRTSTVRVPGGTIAESVYYVPGIIAFGLIAAAFSNLTLTVVRTRESGIYKRRRATPLPAAAVIIARCLIAVLTALAITGVLLGIGWAAYGASIPARTAPAFFLDVIAGSAVFCCLGFAIASLIGTVDAAQPVIQAIVLPLSFISGVFIATSLLPGWLAGIGKVFPVRPLVDALLVAYNPHTTGSGFRWPDLAVLAAWGVAALIVAVRRFSWLPRAG
jgi:ABC-2 type transport system permease protein